MSDAWVEAYSRLVNAIESAKEAGIDESEVMSAVDDVYHEDAGVYVPGPPKPVKPGKART